MTPVLALRISFAILALGLAVTVATSTFGIGLPPLVAASVAFVLTCLVGEAVTRWAVRRGIDKG